MTKIDKTLFFFLPIANVLFGVLFLAPGEQNSIELIVAMFVRLELCDIIRVIHERISVPRNSRIFFIHQIHIAHLHVSAKRS